MTLKTLVISVDPSKRTSNLIHQHGLIQALVERKVLNVDMSRKYMLQMFNKIMIGPQF